MNLQKANAAQESASKRDLLQLDCRVEIVGEHDLGNNILRDYLDEHLEYACVIASANPVSNSTKDALVVYLIDHRRHEDIRAHTACRKCQRSSKSALCALFNIPREHSVNEYLACSKLRGIFYRDTHPSELIRGIKGMLNGQYWIPRSLLVKALCKLPPSKTLSANFLDTKRITARERHVLHMIESGATNQVIASRLNLSEHTVKTHIYNIFRKLEVSNRIQAINLMRSKTVV